MDPLESSCDLKVSQRFEGVPAETFGAFVEPGSHDEGKKRVRQGGDDRWGSGTIVLELGFEEVDDRA